MPCHSPSASTEGPVQTASLASRRAPECGCGAWEGRMAGGVPHQRDVGRPTPADRPPHCPRGLPPAFCWCSTAYSLSSAFFLGGSACFLRIHSYKRHFCWVKNVQRCKAFVDVRSVKKQLGIIVQSMDSGPRLGADLCCVLAVSSGPG